MIDYGKHARAVASGRVHPGWCSICGGTVFYIRGEFLREDYICVRCRSIPRQRNFVRALNAWVPNWRQLESVHESSPGGVSSDYISSECRGYEASQYFADIPSGTYVDGVRREDLQSMTLPDASIDVFLTQDVFEHIPDPDAAWSEISRVLKPGGVHIWTVPLMVYRDTVVRAVPDGLGGVRQLLPPEFHGNPLGGGSLVIHEWGADLTARASAASGLPTVIESVQSWRLGIRGEMSEVLITTKPLG